MKEINDIKESKIINLLIPEAINQNNKLRKEIRQRIRLNKIFKEFENKASNEFNYFINQSNQRYNSLKNGHNLKNLLINSKNRNINEAHKILRDPFYNEFDLEKEKIKMKIIRTKELNKNMSPILSKMKQPETVNLKNIPDFEKNEDMYDFEYNISPNKQNSNYKEYINSIIHDKKKVKNYWSKKPTSIAGKKKLIKFRKNLNIYDKDKNAVSNWFQREQNLINKSVNNYKNIFQTEEKENLAISRKELSNNSIRLPHLRLLNYKLHKDTNRNNQKKDLSKSIINYNYLLSFSDKSIFKQNNPFNTPKKNNNNEMEKDSSLPILTEIDNYSYKFEKYANTLDIVVNSAKKELDKEQDINNKRTKLEKIFGVENTPKLYIYDEILKRKSASIKNQRKHRKIKIIEKQKNLGGNKKDTLNLKIDNNIKLLDDVFQAIDIYNENKQK